MQKPVLTHHLDSVDSTHAFVKRHYREYPKHAITRILASGQTEGRGRSGQSWLSPPGQNLYLTYFVHLSKTQPDLANLAQVTAVTVTQFFDHYDLPCRIKWPNDVLVSRKKIAGTLCEWLDQDDDYAALLSVGINVNMTQETLSVLHQPATSMHLETHLTYALKPLAVIFDNLLAASIDLYERQGFAPFFSTCDRLLVGKGKPICCLFNGTPREGILEGLHTDGKLKVRFSSGELYFATSLELTQLRFDSLGDTPS